VLLALIFSVSVPIYLSMFVCNSTRSGEETGLPILVKFGR